MIATTPIVVPVIVALGYDPVWFGVLFMILIEAALITPPVGMNLFVVQAVRGGGAFREVAAGALPFLFSHAGDDRPAHRLSRSLPCSCHRFCAADHEPTTGGRRTMGFRILAAASGGNHAAGRCCRRAANSRDAHHRAGQHRHHHPKSHAGSAVLDAAHSRGVRRAHPGELPPVERGRAAWAGGIPHPRPRPGQYRYRPAWPPRRRCGDQRRHRSCRPYRFLRGVPAASPTLSVRC